MQVTPVLARVERRDRESRTPGEVIPGISRIAVVRNDRLGDFILTLPAVDAMRRAYPEAEISMLVAPWIVPLGECVEGVNRVVDAPADVGILRAKLEDLAPDLVVCVSRGAAPAIAAFRAGIPHRVGTGFRYYSPLFTRRVSERRRTRGRHELEYALSFAHRVGARAAPASFPLRSDAAARGAIEKWLADREVGEKFVLIHPGSGGSCPRWPLESYLDLAVRLAGDGRPVVFTVGPADDEVLAVADEGPDSIRGIPFFRGSLPNVSEIASRASIVVSNSTSLVHLAAAHGTAALALHAPWTSCGVSRWGPYVDRGWGIVAEAPGARDWSRSERRKLARSLMAGIPLAVVHRCVESILAGERPEV
jgi:ADP-heptose:LPS heptosyltransferase